MFHLISSYFESHHNKELREAIKNIFGFRPGNVFLYKLAFRHKSVSQNKGNYRHNNERLEYLGDSVLSTVVANYLYHKYPIKDEGFLTEMRSKIVSRSNLGKLAHKMGIHKLIHLNGVSGQYQFKSADGDAFEALIGAIFLDKGYKFTEHIIIKRILQLHMDIGELESTEWNFKSKIIDWSQKNKKKINFQVVNTEIQNNNTKIYFVEVILDDLSIGKACEHSIKAAEQLAAEKAYKEYILPLLSLTSS